jgi:hypothetical protein
MRNVALAFVLGLVVGQSRPVAPERPAGPASLHEDFSADAEADDLRFVVELGERANDRVLDDIRAFNAVACALLGPLLAIAAFVDYRDVLSALPLCFTVLAMVSAFAVLHHGDGVPTPSASNDTLFQDFVSNPKKASENVVADLRRWGRLNGAVREQKRRAMRWAGRFVATAVIATVIVKGVESTATMRNNDVNRDFSPATNATDSSGRKVRKITLTLKPEDRHSYAYDLTTNKPVNDDDFDRYMKRALRPWWWLW